MAGLSFTLKSDSGLLNALKTKCGVSLPYIPSPDGFQPEISEFTALWDTGATGSVISPAVVKKLGLLPSGAINVFHADGSCIANTYLINIYLPNHVAFHTITVTEGKLTGMDLLIGMDIISRGDFCISNFQNKTVFSFRYPSQKHTDYVEEHFHTPVVSVKTPGRNDLCLCGSGRKYKNCCINK